MAHCGVATRLSRRRLMAVDVGVESRSSAYSRINDCQPNQATGRELTVTHPPPSHDVAEVTPPLLPMQYPPQEDMIVSPYPPNRRLDQNDGIPAQEGILVPRRVVSTYGIGQPERMGPE